LRKTLGTIFDTGTRQIDMFEKKLTLRIFYLPGMRMAHKEDEYHEATYNFRIGASLHGDNHGNPSSVE
jgi:hypothetical protein